MNLNSGAVVYLNRRYASTNLHGITSQTTVTFSVNTVTLKVKFCKLCILIFKYVLYFLFHYVVLCIICVKMCTVLYCSTATELQHNCSYQIYHIISYDFNSEV